MFNGSGWAETQGQPLSEMEFSRFVGIVDVALRNWFVTGTALARHMAQHGGGVIVGITANAAREAYSNVGGFGVACAAVEHFLRQLAVENGPCSVRVTWVRSPGSPDAPGVRYLAVAGVCEGPLLSPAWKVPHGIVSRAEGANDGVVSVVSTPPPYATET